MDPRKNPYAPGAGKPPPELAGRDDIIERAAIAIDRIRQGRASRSFVFYGLRGVGKTVLLNKIRLDAEARGVAAIPIEAPEGRSLPGILAPSLKSALIRLNRGEAIKDSGARAMRALAGFIAALKIKYQDIEVGIELPPEPGLADSGDLEVDLPELLTAVATAAKDRKTAIILFIDELQYVPKRELATLIAALHRIEQTQLPLAMIAAGLPQILAQLGEAKSYAERLFEFIRIDKLTPAAAREALVKPAAEEKVRYDDGAIEEVLNRSEGYPYFLQEWGKHCWLAADASPITREDAEEATATALADLDASFFRVRFDRLTPLEKRYMRAMAELGPEARRSGEIADLLGKKVTQLGPVRNALIEKGMIYSPGHGENAFTVPLFDGFMKRIMPALEPL
ncbi:MAG: ATP-binding protein [Parvularculaceae bacterium]|nr:ATP-binding protein [Parvularculaceae bacterium]